MVDAPTFIRFQRARRAVIPKRVLLPVWIEFHEEVRRAYEYTLSWGFQDVFVKLYPDRQQYTFWDYRAPGSLEANKGWRIDHILATASLVEHCLRVEVDVEPRRAKDPSDHTFLWAEFSV